MEPAPRPIFGFHGKLPSRGDFVGRGLPRAFTDPWTAWLNDGLRAHPGDGVTDEGWASAPAWHFALPPGFAGPFAVAGILRPSLDRVGRRYALTLAAILPDVSATPDPASVEDWHGAAAACVQAAMADRLAPEALFDALPKKAQGAALTGFHAAVFWMPGERLALEERSAPLIAAWSAP